MSYTPTTWKSGDVVTSAKLNKMESGIESATPYIVSMLWDEDTEKNYLDKTANEIITAMQAGVVIVKSIVDDYKGIWVLINGWLDSEGNAFTVYDQTQPMVFVAPSADAYPVQTEG